MIIVFSYHQQHEKYKIYTLQLEIYMVGGIDVALLQRQGCMED